MKKVDEDKRVKVESILILGDNDFKFLQLHKSDLALVLDIGKYPILMEEDEFHNSALFNKEKVLALGPGIFEGVGEKLALVIGQELDILVVELLFYGGFD